MTNYSLHIVSLFGFVCLGRLVWIFWFRSLLSRRGRTVVFLSGILAWRFTSRCRRMRLGRFRCRRRTGILFGGIMVRSLGGFRRRRARMILGGILWRFTRSFCRRLLGWFWLRVWTRMFLCGNMVWRLTRRFWGRLMGCFWRWRARIFLGRILVCSLCLHCWLARFWNWVWARARPRGGMARRWRRSGSVGNLVVFGLWTCSKRAREQTAGPNGHTQQVEWLAQHCGWSPWNVNFR